MDTKGAWINPIDITMGPKETREINYFITQGLSGHGCFGVDLKRIGKQYNENCWYCQKRATPKHMLFTCERWAENRNKAETNSGGKITPENLLGKMLQDEASRKTLSEMISTMMKIKVKTKERKRKKNNRKKHYEVMHEKAVSWCF